MDRYGPGTQITNGKYDPLSIMHYDIDPKLTKGGFKVGVNQDLSANDKLVIGEMYPFSNTSFMTSSICLATASSLLSIKIEGPDPEIPPPKAPACLLLVFTSSKPGIKILRTGSIITSYSERLLKS